jgi:hypothetical protein
MFTTDGDGEIELEGIEVSELAERIAVEYKISYSEALVLVCRMRTSAIEGKCDLGKGEYLIGTSEPPIQTQEMETLTATSEVYDEYLKASSYNGRVDNYDDAFDWDYAGYDDPIYSPIAFIIAEHFNYEDSESLIEITGKRYSVSNGWEEGFELAGGIIKYAPDYKEFEDSDAFNRFKEPLLEKEH